MRSTRVVYERNFQLAQFIFEKVTHEVIINEGDDFDIAADIAKQQVLDWHKKNNPEIQTDYFKGPEGNQVQKTSKDVIRTPKEKEILKEIKEIDQVEPDQKRFTDWIKKTYPDYLDHITVKTLIKLKSKK